MSAGTERRDTPASLQLFSEVLLVGVFVCVACLPIVTVLAAGGAGATCIRELVESDRTPRLRRFVSLMGTALRDPVGWLAPLALLVVGTLDTVAVLGGVRDLPRVLASTRPATVFVTIPNAPRERLDVVVEECARADVPCRFVRRETDLDPRVVLGAAAE